jgi:hypothetical protein
LPHRSSERKPASLVVKTASSRSLPPSSMAATAFVTLWGSIPIEHLHGPKTSFSRAPGTTTYLRGGHPDFGKITRLCLATPHREREPAGAGQKREPAPGVKGGAGALGAIRPASEEPCCGRSKVPAHIKQVGCPCADDCRCYAGALRALPDRMIPRARDYPCSVPDHYPVRHRWRLEPDRAFAAFAPCHRLKRSA